MVVPPLTKEIFRTPSWWFQPIWKISIKMDHFPKDRGDNKKIFELPPPSLLWWPSPTFESFDLLGYDALDKSQKTNLLPNGGETWVIYLGRKVNISPKNTSQWNGYRINGSQPIPGTCGLPYFWGFDQPSKRRSFPMKIEVIWVTTYLQLEHIEVTKSTDPNLLQKLCEISTPTPHL